MRRSFCPNLRLLDLRVGLLINLHVLMLKDGINRMVNNYQDAPWDLMPGEEAFTAEIAKRDRRERG